MFIKKGKEKFILCSHCFKDEGIKLLCTKNNNAYEGICVNCHSENGAKVKKEDIEKIGYSFFVKGTTYKSDYGHAPIIQCNKAREDSDDFNFSDELKHDISLIQKVSGLKFFYYGPRTWMIGCITPLQELQDSDTRLNIIEKILDEYPVIELNQNDYFYRLRKNPEKFNIHREYDSPPSNVKTDGRFSNPNFSVLYASQDLEVCVHECRVTAEDNLYVAKLVPSSSIRLLDLTHHLDEDCTEFESLDIAIQMLFAAGNHSYEITKDIALAIKEKGYDGVIYPSYFTSLRSGFSPFETAGYGICMRRIPEYKDYLKHYQIPNIAIFGNPVENGLVNVTNINRLLLDKVIYDINLGPIEC